jgi:hypothetical protein
MANALDGAPAFSLNPSHPYELTITFKVESLDQIVQPFRFALWVEGHNQETDFLNYHFNYTRSKTTFLDFLERVLIEVGRYKDSNYQAVLTADFDTCSDKEKHKKNFKHELISVKCSLLKTFIDRKRDQLESKPLKEENDPTEVSQMLFNILDGCSEALLGNYSQERLKRIIFDPLSNLQAKPHELFTVSSKKGDIIFTLFFEVNPIWVDLGPKKLNDFLLGNFSQESGKFGVAYLNKFKSTTSTKRLNKLQTIRHKFMDLATNGREKEVMSSIEKLLSRSKVGQK